MAMAAVSRKAWRAPRLPAGSASCLAACSAFGTCAIHWSMIPCLVLMRRASFVVCTQEALVLLALKVAVVLAPLKVVVDLRAMLLKLAAVGSGLWRRRAALHLHHRLADIAETRSKATRRFLRYVLRLRRFGGWIQSSNYLVAHWAADVQYTRFTYRVVKRGTAWPVKSILRKLPFVNDYISTGNGGILHRVACGDC